MHRPRTSPPFGSMVSVAMSSSGGSSSPVSDFCSPTLMPRAAAVQHISFGISPQVPSRAASAAEPEAPSRTASAAEREEALQYTSLFASVGSPSPKKDLLEVSSATSTRSSSAHSLAQENAHAAVQSAEGGAAGTGIDLPPFFQGDGDVPPPPPTRDPNQGESASGRQAQNCDRQVQTQQSKDEVSGLHFAYRCLHVTQNLSPLLPLTLIMSSVLVFHSPNTRAHQETLDLASESTFKFNQPNLDEHGRDKQSARRRGTDDRCASSHEASGSSREGRSIQTNPRPQTGQ